MASKTKTFTLLTACYNGEKYINDWVQSVLSQSYRPLELIVVDDKSSDRSLRKLRSLKDKFAENDINYKIMHHKKKLYYGNSLRYAMSSATGNYFGILDIDDCLHPDAINAVMNIYRKNKSIAHIYSQYEVCDAELKHIKHGFCRAPEAGQTILSEGLKNIHVYSHWRTFKWAEDIIDIFPKTKYAVDQHMGLKLEQIGPGLFLNQVLYKYRTGLPESISDRLGSQRRVYWRKLLEHFRVNRRRKKIKAFPITQY